MAGSFRARPFLASPTPLPVRLDRHRYQHVAHLAQRSDHAAQILDFDQQQQFGRRRFAVDQAQPPVGSPAPATRCPHRARRAAGPRGTGYSGRPGGRSPGSPRRPRSGAPRRRHHGRSSSKGFSCRRAQNQTCSRACPSTGASRPERNLAMLSRAIASLRLQGNITGCKRLGRADCIAMRSLPGV